MVMTSTGVDAQKYKVFQLIMFKDWNVNYLCSKLEDSRCGERWEGDGLGRLNI